MRDLALYILIFIAAGIKGQISEESLYPAHSSIIVHSYYTLEYLEEREQARWVFYELTSYEAKGKVERTYNFRADGSISTGSASPMDYRYSGYDRGHLAPAGDMAFNYTAMSESFLMSNMSPQDPSFNRGVWKSLEAQVRSWAIEDGDIYIITGPIFTESNENAIGNGVYVPEYYFKVVLDLNDNGNRAIAFILPNRKGDRVLPDYSASVDSVEKLSGIDFFSGLADPLENSLERKIVGPWDYSVSSSLKTQDKVIIAVQCKGTTQKGLRCKRRTKNPSGYCWQHGGQQQTKISEPVKKDKRNFSVRCQGITQKGVRCKRMTKNAGGYCWQHD